MTGRSRNLIKAGDPGAIVMRRAQVHHTGTAPCEAKSDAEASPGASPTIVLHRTADTIDAIEVTCVCGHTIIIECEYAEEG